MISVIGFRLVELQHVLPIMELEVLLFLFVIILLLLIMIIKKMDIRPGSAVPSRMHPSPDCVTIVSKFHDYSKERNMSHRNATQAVLPAFSQLPVKSLTRLLYDRFAVKGLNINRKTSPKKISVCNRA